MRRRIRCRRIVPALLAQALILVALAAVFALPLRAQSPLPAPAIKAAFLVNFARYAEWPTDAGVGPLNVCLMGRDPAVLTAAAIDGKVVGGRSLQTRRAAALDELTGCHVLFIAASEERRAALILKAIENQPVLTVSDVPGFVDEGGMIGLVESGERFEFDVNLGVTQRAGIKLSAGMLKLARRIIGAKPK